MHSQSPLLTDLYQLTMGYGYWKNGMAEHQAVFHLFYRKPPFGESAVVVAGIEDALEYLEGIKFSQKDIDYLAGLTGNDGEPLFEKDYLSYLLALDFSVDVMAMREGEIAYSHAPLMRVQGPMIVCQLIETAVLNQVNFQSLVATQAARLVEVADQDEVLEFGLRRAQGPDGGVSASRAAYIGGCSATSNVLAGQLYDIPVKGTHAHSWVMSFQNEQESFESYARTMPNNTVILVDTYDTLEGVRKAVQVGLWLKEKGHRMLGIRLDSGDLLELSKASRILLDQAGLTDAKIVASNDLDVETIRELKANGSKIDIWGVGTKLVTCFEQPALGGVYKLAAIEGESGWQWKVKLSNDFFKVSNPGILQVVRKESEDLIVHDPDQQITGLLDLVMEQGRRTNMPESIHTIQQRALREWPKRSKNQQVRISQEVQQMKEQCIQRAMGACEKGERSLQQTRSPEF